MDAAHTPAARMMQDQPRADNVILPDALPRRHFISSHLLLIAKAEGLFSPGHMLPQEVLFGPRHHVPIQVSARSSQRSILTRFIQLPVKQS